MTTVVEQLEVLGLLEELTEEQVECLAQYEGLEDIVNCLDMDEYMAWENDNEFLSQFEPLELAQKIFYGDYRFMDDYIQFDGYGNFKTISKYEYFGMLEDNAMSIIEYALECNDLL